MTMQKKRIAWIVCCNSTLIALSAYAVYREKAFWTGFVGLVPPALWQIIRKDLSQRTLDIGLAVGIVAELARWRAAVIINSLSYVAVAAFAIWGSLQMYGEIPYLGQRVFLKAVLLDGIPEFLVSILNLWLYRKDWRRLLRSRN